MLINDTLILILWNIYTENTLSREIADERIIRKVVERKFISVRESLTFLFLFSLMSLQVPSVGWLRVGLPALTRRSEALQWGFSWSRPAFAGAWQARIEGETADRVLRGAGRPLGAGQAPTVDTSCEDSRLCDPCCYRCWASPRTAVVVARCRCTAPRLAVLLGTWSEKKYRTQESREISTIFNNDFQFPSRHTHGIIVNHCAFIWIFPSGRKQNPTNDGLNVSPRQCTLIKYANAHVMETKRYRTVTAVATCSRKNTTTSTRKCNLEGTLLRATSLRRCAGNAANFCSPSFRPS